MRLLRIIGLSFRDTYNELFLMVILSLLWWLAMITVVASAPATLALAHIGYRIAREKRVDFDFAKEAFRNHFWLGWRIGIVGLVSLIIIIGNLLFYLQLEGWLQGLAFFFLYLLTAWLTVFLYGFALVSAMKDRSMRAVLRNAALLTFANPIFSFLLALALVLLAGISVLVILPLLLAPGLVAIMGGRALVDRLEVMEEKRARQDNL
jgi:uncharacterized membrane protein YesL